ncbi:hypothetical protein QQP08_001121 [Theobroma cacao]|nr:hypothetical protein QQP08_001121 [Theobroma cacao]
MKKLYHFLSHYLANTRLSSNGRGTSQSLTISIKMTLITYLAKETHWKMKAAELSLLQDNQERVHWQIANSGAKRIFHIAAKQHRSLGGIWKRRSRFKGGGDILILVGESFK